MKKLISFIFIIFCSSFFSQTIVDESKYFLYFYNDKVVYYDSIEFRSPEFSNDYFYADSNKIIASQVKFFKNEYGFFANKSSQQGEETLKKNFVLRITVGNLNFYGTSDISDDKKDKYHIGSASYYNKKYGDIKPMKAKNLLVDMSGNKTSVKYLRKYIKKTNKSLTLFGASAAIACLEFVPFPIEAVFAVTGIGVFISGFFPLIKVEKLYTKAIVNYMKQ